MTETLTQPDDLTSRLDFALAVSAEASGLILRYYQNPDLEVERKRDSSPERVASRRCPVTSRP